MNFRICSDTNISTTNKNRETTSRGQLISQTIINYEY